MEWRRVFYGILNVYSSTSTERGIFYGILTFKGNVRFLSKLWREAYFPVY